MQNVKENQMTLIKRNQQAGQQPIVAEAELEEHQLLAHLATACLQDHFAIGRYCLQWHRRYSRGRSDAALAHAVIEAHPDAMVSTSFIRQHRIVAAVFNTRVGGLSWTHHRVAVELDKKNAAKWLEKAEAKGWSSRRLQNEITRKITGNGAALEPQNLRAINRTFRQLFRRDKSVSNPGYVRDVLKTLDSYAINHKKEIRTLVKDLKESADVWQNFLDKH
ncbi:MAG: hypothetical protein KAV00_16040 [Phycisphaerae bacterium]|nr:hypothetical protein [Phycisphaerae bacterium]